jgi:hypothetical protein
MHTSSKISLSIGFAKKTLLTSSSVISAVYLDPSSRRRSCSQFSSVQIKYLHPTVLAMATPNDQGRNEQENLPRGVEVENNIVAVESTRHRRRCLVLIVIVVLCFIVIGGGVSVPFVLPLISQSGKRKKTHSLPKENLF